MEPTFTDRQLDLMNILWEEGSATVREAREEITEDLAYTSVLTVFQTLEKNGHVRHEPEGKAYRYYPTVSRSQAGKAATSHVLRRVFDGSAEKFLRALAAQETVASEEGRSCPERSSQAILHPLRHRCQKDPATDRSPSAPLPPDAGST